VSAEARYLRVGSFVLGGIVLAVVAVLLVAGGSLLQRPIVIETYFDESVQGVEIGSAVKLRGVKLGTVSQIGFVGDVYALSNSPDPVKEGNLVLVRMEVGDSSAGASRAEREEALKDLVAKGLRLRLTPLGITGVSFIQADYLDPAKYPPMQISFEPQHLYVPSAPSTITQISSAAERLLTRIDKLDVESLLTNLDELLVSVNRAVTDAKVEELRHSVADLLADLRQTSSEMRGAIRKSDVPGVGEDARVALRETTAALLRVQEMLDGGGDDLGAILENLRVASQNLRDASDTARAYPSYFLLGEPPRQTPAPEARP
jgi:phospholipid/cholesterol/gamma-HCH transport system substrate-binding protein/paraquat-inducible protein B